MMYRSALVGLLMIIGLAGRGQTDSVVHATDRPSLSSLAVPTVLTAYGFAALRWDALKTFDRQVRKVVWTDNPHRPFHLDNYLQYSPAAAAYVLNAVGVHGRHDLLDRTIIYLVAEAIMGTAVESLKHTINAPRPDGSGNDGFPSGHTATAFVAAEFMSQEFRHLSPWYSVAGYTLASGTAYLRVYNDKHWFSELATGAGIGILASKVSYWLYPAIERKLRLRKRPDYKW